MYDWYVDVRLLDSRGKEVSENTVHLGMLYASEINTPKLFKDVLRKSLLMQITDFPSRVKKTRDQQLKAAPVSLLSKLKDKSPRRRSGPGAGRPTVPELGKIVIVRRYRHFGGMLPYSGERKK